MSDSDAPGLGRASVLMASGSMVSRVLGVVRNALMIMILAAEAPASKAFNTANTLPNSIFALLQGGLLTTLFLPQLTKAMKRDDGGEDTVNALLTWSFVAVGLVTVVATAAAQPLSVLLRLSGPTLDLGVAFAFLCLPQIFFYGVYTIWSQVLYTRDRFGITMWATVFANVVQIVGMVAFLAIFGRRPDAVGWTPAMVWLLAGSFTLGIAVQALALLPSLRRSGFRWRPNLTTRGHGFRATGRLASWTVAAVVLAQLGGVVTTMAINQVTDRVHDVANITVYLQAFTMFFVPHGIVAVSILTALFPRITRAHQDGDASRLRADVARALRLLLVVMLPLSIAAVVLSVPGMAVVSPGMSPREVDDTALAFSIMALGLVPYAVSGLQQRYSMAREDGRTNLWFVVVVTAAQVAAAVAILFLPPSVGVPVVAAGMTLGNAVAAAWFLGRVHRQLGGLPLADLGRLGLRLLGATVPAGAAAWGVGVVVRERLGFGWLPMLADLAASAVVFGVLFLLAARLLRITDVTAVASRLLGRLRRR